MRLLSKNVRDTKTVKPAMLVEGVGRPEGADRLIESTQAIGVRYETIHGGLDSIARVVEHLRAIEPLLSEIRQPVAKEFEARRAEHAELIALRANYEMALRQAAVAKAEERETAARLQQTETALGESDARRQAQDTALEDSALEIDRLRNGLLQSDLKAGSLDASLRDANARIEHLVQDVDTLRVQSQDIDARRGEAEASLARVQQQNALLTEEVATLKKRLDQAGFDVARLSRVETDLEAQIAAERARLQAAENALSVHQTDSSRTIRGLESQVETGRAEISALQTRLETATGRADKLEEMNGQMATRLAESSASSRLSSAGPATSTSPSSGHLSAFAAWKRKAMVCASVMPVSTPPVLRPSSARTSWPRARSPTKRPSSGRKSARTSCASVSRRCSSRRTRLAASTRTRSPNFRPRSIA